MIQRLENVTTASDESSCEETDMVEIDITSDESSCEETDMVEIDITSDEWIKRVYDAIVKLCGIQGTRSRVEAVHLLILEIKKPTTDILSSLHLLSFDFEQHSITACISQGEVKNVATKIDQLGDLLLDEAEFARQCHTVKFEMLHTSQQADEDRVVSILQHIPNLKGLHIIYFDEHSLPIIGLVISAREKILQSGGSLALRTFELKQGTEMDARIEATVFFSEGSATFDMKARMLFYKEQLVADDPVCEFVRRYGWSITYLRSTFNDHLATLLDESTQERGSQIVHLDVHFMSLSTSGLDALDRAIKRSQQLASLKYTISNLDQVNVLKYADFLVAHGRWLERLKLCVESDVESWLPRLSQAIPSKSVFPVLQELTICGRESPGIPRGCGQWIATMVAAPSQPPHISSIPPPSTDDKLPAGTSQRGLRRLELNFVTFQHEEWKSVINAIDLSVLECLDFQFTNFSQKELTFLVDRIAEYASRISLRSMRFQHSDLQKDNPGTLTLCEKLRNIAPKTQVEL